MLLCLCRSHHESRIGHVGIYLLNHEILRSLSLVLVGPLPGHLVLPCFLPCQVFPVSLADVFHHITDRHLHARFSGSCSGKQTGHQRGLMLHIVDILEAGFPEMRGERREHGMCHGRLIDFGRATHEQGDESGQFLGHRRRCGIVLLLVLLRHLLTAEPFSLRIDADHLARHGLATVVIAGIEVADELLAVTLLCKGGHALLHHPSEFLFAHHPAGSGTHDGEERGVARTYGIDIYFCQPSLRPKEVESDKILIISMMAPIRMSRSTANSS